MRDDRPGPLRRWLERRRELAARQAWWLIAGAGLLVAWGRVAARWLDPPGPTVLDWVATLVRALEFQLGCAVALLLVGAAMRRSLAQVLATAALLALTVVLPLLHGIGRHEPEADSADALRVLAINVLYENGDVAGTARTIESADADIVIVSEYSRHWPSRLPGALGEEWRLVVSYPGIAAFARDERAAYDGTVEYIGEDDTVPLLRIVANEDADESAVVYGVHLHGPFRPSTMLAARAEARDLVRLIRAEDSPLLVAGDFNAVPGSAIDRSIREAGMRDAWRERGRGPGWTWPRNGVLRYLPGVLVDHVYVSADWSVHEVRLLASGGSDHRPVLAEISRERS